MEAAELATAPRTRVAMIAPQRLTVVRGTVDVRVEPRQDAELVDQMHYGETGAILARRSGWAYVQADDHYFGWITESAAAADPSTHGGLRIVAFPVADVHERPDAGSRVVDRLPAGTWLPVHPQVDKAGWVWLSAGWIRSEATVLYGELPHRPPTADDLLATAEAFLGVPYLWGGTTALGMDCSGYVQQVYRLNGIRLDRDADQQAMEGRPVDEAIAGDLLFFGAERITHVAISTGGEGYLHAPQSGALIQRGTFATRAPGLARRYLADPS